MCLIILSGCGFKPIHKLSDNSNSLSFLAEITNSVSREIVEEVNDNLFQQTFHIYIGAFVGGSAISILLHNSEFNLSIFSFYYGHHISTIEGGMVCSKNDELHDLAKMFRSHGMIREASQELQDKYKNNYKDLNPLFTFAVPGFNLRSTEINAFIGLQQMQKIDLIIKKRSDNLNHWLKNLNKDKYLPPQNHIPLLLKFSFYLFI